MKKKRGNFLSFGCCIFYCVFCLFAYGRLKESRRLAHNRRALNADSYGLSAPFRYASAKNDGCSSYKTILARGEVFPYKKTRECFIPLIKLPKRGAVCSPYKTFLARGEGFPYKKTRECFIPLIKLPKRGAVCSSYKFQARAGVNYPFKSTYTTTPINTAAPTKKQIRRIFLINRSSTGL